MGFIKFEFEFGKSKFDKELIKFLQFLYCLYRITLRNWKEEGKKKRPRLLDFPLVKTSTIISISLIIIIPFSAFLLQFEKWQIIGQIFLFFVFLFVAIALVFILILFIVYSLYLLLRLGKTVFKTIRFIIDEYRDVLRKK